MIKIDKQQLIERLNEVESEKFKIIGKLELLAEIEEKQKLEASNQQQETVTVKQETVTSNEKQETNN